MNIGNYKTYLKYTQPKLIDRIQIWLEKRIYKVYTSLDFIPVGCFFKILDTQDLRYMFRLKSYEHMPVIKYRPKVQWDKLYSDFIAHNEGLSLVGYVSDYGYIINQRELFLRLKHTAFLLSIKEDKELIGIVKKCGYKFEYKNDLEYAEALSDFNRQLIGLNKVIDRKTNEFIKKYKNSNHKIDIYEILNSFEQYKQRRIDPWTTSMTEFLTIQKGYKNWVKSYGRQSNK